MKRVINKDGSIDYHFKGAELDNYMLGCIIGGNYQDGFVIRVRGRVKDLKNVVFKAE